MIRPMAITSVLDLAARPAAVVQPGVLLARGVCRAMLQRGWATVTEMTLANGRRADIVLVGGDGTIAIIEVKSSIADFMADRKWGDYRAFCDALYFAVPDDFPQELIPADCGLIVADHFAAEILRTAPCQPLPGARRKAMLVRFAQLASARLARLADPHANI